MLPERFHWQPRHSYSDVADGLFLGTTLVGMLFDRGQAGWLALLEAHQAPGNSVPTRHVTSYQAGRDLCEAWALRHEARLRQEVAGMLARRPALKA